MLLDYVAVGLVLAGFAAVGRSLLINRRLIATLPAGGSLRRRWQAMTVLAGVFVLGYALYLMVGFDREAGAKGLVVPVIFFFGGLFVWLTAKLSLQTAESAGRVAVLEHEAVTDPLTSLYNRRYLDRRLDCEVAQAVESGASLSVLAIDLDYLKTINDRLGHQFGDLVLAKLAQALIGSLGRGDFAARYGGDEFIVVAPRSDLAAAEALGERFRAAIERYEFEFSTHASSPEPLSATVSIGVASLGGRINTPKAVLHAADECLYRAKRLGRNRVATTEPGRVRPLPRPLPAAAAAA